MNINGQDNAEILFVCPNLDYTKPWDFTFSDHLGASYVRAYLKSKGILSNQFIYRQAIDLNTLIREILKHQAGIIGFTVYDTTYSIVKTISENLKKVNPDLIILAGGVSATFSDRFILENSPAIDICVRREGEYTAYELINQLKEGGNIGNVEGITYRSNGNIVRNPDRALIQGQDKGAELDILPSPFLTDVVIPEDNFGLVTSRGCIYRCTYCNFASMSNWTIRYHSVGRVISELKEISKAVHHVPILDDTFTLSLARAKQICRRIIDEKFDLTFWCQTRADKVDGELLQLMYQAGFKKATFGLESAIPRVLKNVQKVRTNSTIADDDLGPEKEFIAKMQENIKLAKDIGMDPEVNIIIGLPGATLDDDKETIEFVKGLQVNSYVHHTLNIYPGTELFQTHQQYGIGLRPSATGIPYNTLPAYDHSKIQEMKNAQKHLYNNQQADLILKIMTGNYGHCSNTGYSYILFKHGFPLGSELIQWLNEFTLMNPKLIYLTGDINDEKIRANLKKIIDSNILLFNCYSLACPNVANSGVSGVSREHAIVLNTSDSFKIIGSFLIVPISEFINNGLNSIPENTQAKNRIVFAWDNDFVVQTLIKPESQQSINENSSLLKDLSKLEFSFLDACRWLDYDCPALTFQRVIIGEDSSISPCFHGRSVGRVGESRQEIAGRLEELRNKVELERGCNSCLVKNSCSKCLFISPLSAEEFCSTKKQGTAFSDFIKLSKF
jgi:radical SAM superfamily enzyme YgiQ (UPF0313 family)